MCSAFIILFIRKLYCPRNFVNVLIRRKLHQEVFSEWNPRQNGEEKQNHVHGSSESDNSRVTHKTRVQITTVFGNPWGEISKDDYLAVFDSQELKDLMSPRFWLLHPKCYI